MSQYVIENITHECQQCHMKFYNSQELVNHTKKFCTPSGLHTLQGLAHFENTSKLSKNLKNYGAKSITGLNYEPEFSAGQLAKEARQVEMHREHLTQHRPYTNQKKQVRIQEFQGLSNTRGRQIGSRLGTQTRNINEGLRRQQLLGNSEVSMHVPNAFVKSRVLNQSNQSVNQPQRQDQTYFSPPTNIYKPLSKPAPTVLDKSNSSIAKMSQSQKKDYAVDKLLQLDSIDAMYDQGGGASMDFRKNVEKMRKFYKKMLEEGSPNKNYPGQFCESRVQTPISKLRELQQGQEGAKSRKYMEDSLDRQMGNKNGTKEKQIKKSQPLKKKKKVQNPQFQPFNPYFQPYMQYPNNPQIIMMPPYPHQNPYPIQQPTHRPQINDQIKYLQKMMQLKNEENKKLMKMLIDTRRERDQGKTKSRIQQIHQSQALQFSRAQQKKPYHMETPMEMLPSAQEKILIALQRQQLDELRLLSTLPQQLQQIKMQSVMKLIQQRTQLQKEILKQKILRLEQQQKNQLYEQEVFIEKDDWANQQRKKLVAHQMNDIMGQFRKKVKGEDSDSGEEDEDGSDPQEDEENSQQKE